MFLLAQSGAPAAAGYPVGLILVLIAAGLAALAIVGTSAVAVALISRRKQVCPHCGKRP
jgi:hypothetical protein